MAIATRHRDDPVNETLPLPGLTIAPETDPGLMAAVMGKPESEMIRRFAAGHRAYLAWFEGWPAAWGWVATRTAEIGELDSTLTLPPGARYLWNFVTLPSRRGNGIYPRLLGAIIRAESDAAERFWIAYAPENHASAAGIRKAGFTTVADLSFDRVGRPALRDRLPGGASEPARMLDLPVAESPLAPCWRCVRQGKSASMSCAAGQCACDYQRAESACAGEASHTAIAVGARDRRT